MSSYEFWDELGKIFNAVVAYQEKNIEFNRRFISPWIRLGNVFEKQDRNKEAVEAYEKAIEMDEANPQNWFELGNIHFKTESHSDAVRAFNRAIELDPGFGWAYNNLALTLVTSGETEQAVALYQRAIELLQDPKDKAVAWNRLGNAYRKLNQYEQALESFHRADEFDLDNGGFRDSLDEVSEGPTLVSAAPDRTGQGAQPVNVSSIELIVADSRAAEAQAPTNAAGNKALKAARAKGTADLQAGAEAAGMLKAVHLSEETVAAVMGNNTETFTATLPAAETAGRPSEMGQTPAGAESPTDEATLSAEVVTSNDIPLAEEPGLAAAMETETASMALEETRPTAAVNPAQEAAEAMQAAQDPAADNLAAQLREAEPEALDFAQQVAYEEYLKDTNEAVHGFDPGDGDESEVPGSPEPVAKLDESGELQIEMDTKNAHVWNELGNVYFNTSAYDDAIVAYSKAIELDRWFAWPYSNLALAYVQKRRFVEAILLYQRSIDLFSSDKDKAISWNRLGNVYRRLNDYENAIAAYQRADALDPDNSTLSLQSRFSLLGNYATEQKPSYVS